MLVSVREGLLAILGLGPAYGLQLHGEFASRAPHRGPVNVGQVYSTLDRLGKHGLIASAGLSDDGLPLHRITAEGQAAVDLWLARPDTASLPEWTDMLDQVFVASTLDRDHALGLAAGFLDWWAADRAATELALKAGPLASDARLALLARRAQADAALAWLHEVRRELAANDSARGYGAERPKRGRRARQAATA